MTDQLLLFDWQAGALAASLLRELDAASGEFNMRNFPDGESYLRVDSAVSGRHCLVLADLSRANEQFLPLIFLADTLKELGASSVGIVAPYLSYMRQDCRFQPGEAITSRIFARALSAHFDWLVTVDPHLHRYHSLQEIYTMPSEVVQGAPALADWLQGQRDIFLVGPDAESEQWLAQISAASGHPFVIGQKQRFGDRDVRVTLPELTRFQGKSAVIIDDVISSGQTIIKCQQALVEQGISTRCCLAVHGIFADDIEQRLRAIGISQLVTSNSIVHCSNAIDLAPLLRAPIQRLVQQIQG